MSDVYVHTTKYSQCRFCGKTIPDYAICNCEEISNNGYNQALEDAEKRYREWLKSEYGKVADDDMLPIRVLRSLTK